VSSVIVLASPSAVDACAAHAAVLYTFYFTVAAVTSAHLLLAGPASRAHVQQAFKPKAVHRDATREDQGGRHEAAAEQAGSGHK
jgi:outer membrane murein-binding lipoprotein Lpp